MSAFSDYIAGQLTADLEWRESELVILKKALLQTSIGSQQENTLLRANLALVYAHYEGFCKFSIGVYIDALNKLKIPRKDLNWKLALLSMNSFIADVKNESQPAEVFLKLSQEFNNQIELIAQYEQLSDISNLWPDLLILLLQKYNLSSSIVSDNKLILESLVTKRNQIAHGKGLLVKTRSELEKHYEVATLAMHAVAISICEALEKESYRRVCHVSTIFNHAIDTPVS